MTRDLSIFIDESGDFGKFDSKSPYYIVTLIFHDQKHTIHDKLDLLSRNLSMCGYPEHVLHTGPLIRKEQHYQYMDINERRRILNYFMAFAAKINFSYKTFVVAKQEKADQFKLISLLSKHIKEFIDCEFSALTSFDNIIIYYDNGQKQLTSILASNFTFSNVSFRLDVKSSEYRLSQIADLVTTFELINLKREYKCNSNSEQQFFKSMRNFYKDYYKRLSNKKL